ncbi:MAG TPA: hypothetical protein VNC17_02160 [Thermoleophilaceae bacterium]|jgi:hypothetical protein|nr:hypothetical protein [Thermoleophilaceae bacterium]
MNDEPEGGLAERRLDEHLELLRATPPSPGTALVPRVVRKARWQSYLRAPLRVVGMIGFAFVHGLSALLGGGKSR